MTTTRHRDVTHHPRIDDEHRLQSMARTGRSTRSSVLALAAASLVLTLPLCTFVASEAAAQEKGEKSGAGAGGAGGGGEKGGKRDQAQAPSSREGGGGNSGSGERAGGGPEKSANEGAKAGRAEGPSQSQRDTSKANEAKQKSSDAGDGERNQDRAKSDTGREKAAETNDRAGSRGDKERGDKDRKDTSEQNSDKQKASETKSSKSDDDRKADDEKSRADRDKAKSENDNARADSDKSKTERDKTERDKTEGEKSRDTANAPQLDEKTRETADRKVREVKEKVTSNERDKARDVFTRTDLKRATNVNIRVNVGIALPHSVTLYDVPRDVVEIVPVYREYRYVEIDDAICIVDPETFVIVDVIDRGGRHASSGASGGEAGHGGRLVLTSDQERFIREHIDHDHRSDLNIRLSIGSDIPGDIELRRFPERIVTEVPVIRDYRYVVVDDGVIIVDPDRNNVVYRIEG